ncbi:AI-2E family transporter [Candidatus Gracilibacteria bacterium]|nr:AI-2E family transporter [Candidatus Gracilibacteria bacterium]
MNLLQQRNPYIVIFFTLSLILSFFVLQPYIISIIIAIIVANLLRPVYNYILRHTYKSSPSMASGLTILFFIIAILAPSILLISIAAEEAILVGKNIRTGVEYYVENPEETPLMLQQGLQYLTSYDIIGKLSESIGKIGGVVLGGIGSLGSMTLSAVLKIFIFFYCIYFFLKDGKYMMEYLISYIPLKTKDTHCIIDTLKKTTFATLKGTFIIGIIQGTLAGIGFFIAGIPGAVFWGVIMILLSAIPMAGAPIVWIPVCLYLALTGDYVTAGVLGLYCGVIVGNIDNLLRPRLVGKDVGMHEILVLISTLGGIAFFGISGFIIGPTIIAFSIALGDIYKASIKKSVF